MHTFVKDTVCSAPTCTKSAASRTLCLRHYGMARRGNVLPPTINQKGIRRNTGRTTFQKGSTPWNKNKKDCWKPEHIDAIKKANTGRKPVNYSREFYDILKGGSEWKGGSISYRSLHKWVVNHLGRPDTCINCETTGLTGHKIHWANISHEYKRTESDWMRLCAKCHGAYDSNKLTLTQIVGY